MYMFCLFYTNDTYDLSPRVLCLYWHYSYLSATSLGQGEIIGLLVIQYEMIWDVNTSPLFFLVSTGSSFQKLSVWEEKKL